MEASEKLLREVNKLRKIYYENDIETRKAIGVTLAGDVDMRSKYLSGKQTSHKNMTAERIRK